MNIMIVGVGGQGTLLASRILGGVALAQGFDVKVSEVHGMSQRGGSVVTYVKYGKEVHSPIIPEGEADVILAFEQLEACRYLEYLKKNGKLLVNSQKINPLPVIIGAAKYPDELIAKIKATGASVFETDALALAEKAGSTKAANVVLIGLLASRMDIPQKVWQDVIAQTVPPKFLEINKKAFEAGYNL